MRMIMGGRLIPHHNTLGPGEGRIVRRLAGVTAAGHGTVRVAGSVSATLGGVSISASGTVADPAGETVSITVAPASWHDREQASYQGSFGSTVQGRYIALPASAGGTDAYVYCVQDDGSGNYTGPDPGDFVPGLAAYTGIAAQLAAGNVSADDRATAIRSALTDSGLYTSVGGSGATVSVQGLIDGGSAAVGGLAQGSYAGRFGTRGTTPQFNTTDLSGSVGQVLTWGEADGVITAIGFYLNGSATDVRAAVYIGGSTSSLTGATLVSEVLVPGGGSPGWRWAALEPASCALVQTGDVVRVILKSNGTSEPGYRLMSSLGTEDWEATRDLEVYSGFSSDPSVAFPSTLNSASATTPSAVFLYAAIQVIADDGTDAEFTTRWGLQISDPTDLASESSLLAPDPGGADLFMGAAAPNLLGMVLRSWAIAHGATHSTQVRGFVASGGSVGNAVGATVVWQGRPAGSATNAWYELAADDSPIDESATLWWGCRNDANTVSFRFAFNAARTDADPDDNPCDWTDSSEYEIFNSTSGTGTGAGAHDTDPDNAVATPIATNGGATATNTNYPGGYLVLAIPPDAIA